MGVVNVTPDSFFAPSRRRGALDAAEAALAMEAAGAALVDLGGESTRPGSDYVSEEEELERVVPAVRAIRARTQLPLSIDTRKAAVASAALDAGADIVNDVSALRDDPAMAGLIASRGAAVVLMHMKGDPKTMQAAPRYEDCALEVRLFLEGAARAALEAGIGRDRIVLDPGIGFGKSPEDNLALLGALGDIVGLGYPVLVGLSRKSFVGAVLGHAGEVDAEAGRARIPDGRLAGSLGAACAAYRAGAAIFRVHDVAETVDALALYRAASRGRLGRSA